MADVHDPGTDRRILVVDDEKNIRLTLSEALVSMGLTVDTAADGEEALARLQSTSYWMMLLDIKMPGLDGMEVLRRVHELHPEVRTIMITAHGTVEYAVEAMKLGAVDFLEKPFSTRDIRALVRKVMERDMLKAEEADGYEALIELARRAITHRQFDKARDFVREALRHDDRQPEAHNLMGVLYEIAGDRLEAQNSYRRALELDETFAPARYNLRASVEPHRKTSFVLGEAKVDKDGPGR